jgi:hypothetical protein
MARECRCGAGQRRAGINDPNSGRRRRARVSHRFRRRPQQCPNLVRPTLRILLHQQSNHTGHVSGGQRATRQQVVTTVRGGSDNIDAGRRCYEVGSMPRRPGDPAVRIARNDRNHRIQRELFFYFHKLILMNLYNLAFCNTYVTMFDDEH